MGKVTCTWGAIDSPVHQRNATSFVPRKMLNTVEEGRHLGLVGLVPVTNHCSKRSTWSDRLTFGSVAARAPDQTVAPPTARLCCVSYRLVHAGEELRCSSQAVRVGIESQRC